MRVLVLQQTSFFLNFYFYFWFGGERFIGVEFTTHCDCFQAAKPKEASRPSLSEYRRNQTQNKDEKEDDPLNVDFSGLPEHHESSDSEMPDAGEPALDQVKPPPPPSSAPPPPLPPLPVQNDDEDVDMTDFEDPPSRQPPSRQTQRVEPLAALMPPNVRPPGSPPTRKQVVYVGTDEARPPTDPAPGSSPLSIADASVPLGPHPTRPSGVPTNTPIGVMRGALGLVPIIFSRH